MSPCAALQKLIDGNIRFSENKSIHPNLGNELRSSLISEQNPFAAILACSDSRVPVEIIFDAGLGDLFVVRSAGHVLSKEALGSLEYAVKTLGVKLIVIMGHDNCGAINSALEICNSSEYWNVSENMQALLSHIYPAIKDVECKNGDLLNSAVEANINYQVHDLFNRNAFLADKISKEELILVGAKYSLNTGKVELWNEYKTSSSAK